MMAFRKVQLNHRMIIIRQHLQQQEERSTTITNTTRTITTFLRVGCSKRRLRHTPYGSSPAIIASSSLPSVLNQGYYSCCSSASTPLMSAFGGSCSRITSPVSYSSPLFLGRIESAPFQQHPQQQQQQQRRHWSDEPIPQQTTGKRNNNNGGSGRGSNRGGGGGGGGGRRMDNRRGGRRGGSGGGRGGGRQGRNESSYPETSTSGRAGRGGGRGSGPRGGRVEREGRGGRGAGRVEREGRGGRGDGRGRHGRQRVQPDRFEDSYEKEEEVAAVKATSITVAKRKGGGGGKYCYGCGATIVKGSEQEKTVKGGGGSYGGNSKVSMGIETKRGGYWQEKKTQLQISKIKNWGLCARCKDLKRGSKNDDELGDRQLEALSPSHEMTQIFREQVSKLRQKEDAVVVLCVDAVNVKGSLIRTLRNYVGGNPILLAVTRCDLLPPYASENWSPQKEEQIKSFFMKQASDLNPADVYLCSVDDNNDDYDDDDEEIFNGTRKLAEDLWNHLDGRDPYIVGAANIGKSTLTDRLIEDFVRRQQRQKKKGDNHDDYDYKYNQKRRDRSREGRESRSRDSRRLETILESRVTKSSLPGTTLQNVRVPCFPDFTQALWDTPGLLLDPSLSHYPIRNFRRIKARRPTQIKPQWHNVNERSFACLVYEQGDSSISFDDNEEDPPPLLRIEIRLKREKKDKEEGAKDSESVHLVWNSILDVLSTDVKSIEKALTDEKKRKEEIEIVNNQRKERERENQRAAAERAPKDREQRKLEYLERVKAEKEEMGAEAWNEREKAREEEQYQIRRLKTLAQLKKVFQKEIPGGEAIEIDVEHFGNLGILSPRAALVRVFAPSDGISPASHPAMVVPPLWEDSLSYEEYPPGDALSDDDDDDDDNNEYDEWDENLDDDEFYGGYDEYDEFGRYAFDDMYHDSDSEVAGYQRGNSAFVKAKKRWTEVSGKRVGWVFDDTRYMRGELLSGWFPIEEEEEN